MPLFRCAVLWVLLWSLGSYGGAAPSAVPTVVAGSKRFTESHVLGEIVRSTLADARVPAEHKPGLGNTGILEQVLVSGAVGVYPEYTGSIVRELLHREGNPSLAELNTWLSPRGLKAAVPPGLLGDGAIAVARFCMAVSGQLNQELGTQDPTQCDPTDRVVRRRIAVLQRPKPRRPDGMWACRQRGQPLHALKEAPSPRTWCGVAPGRL